MKFHKAVGIPVITIPYKWQTALGMASPSVVPQPSSQHIASHYYYGCCTQVRYVVHERICVTEATENWIISISLLQSQILWSCYALTTGSKRDRRAELDIVHREAIGTWTQSLEEGIQYQCIEWPSKMEISCTDIVNTDNPAVILLLRSGEWFIEHMPWLLFRLFRYCTYYQSSRIKY